MPRSSRSPRPPQRPSRAVRRLAAGLLVLGVAVPGSASAQELEVRNGFTFTSGQVDTFVAGDGYAYAGDGGAITVYDTASGTPVARRFLPGQIRDLELVGSTLYVAARNIGLRVIDVSTPTSPVETGSYVPSDGDVRGVAVAGAYAYLMVQKDGGVDVRTVRLSDLVLTGVFSAPSTDHTVYLLGRLEATSTCVVYTALDTTGAPTLPTDFGVLDTRSTPENPQYVGNVTPAGATRGLYGDPSFPLVHVALHGSFQGLQVYDLTDPAAPVDNGAVALPSGYSANVVVAEGRHVYVGSGGSVPTEGTVAVYKLVTPGVPTLLAGSETPTGLRINSLAVDGDTLFAGGGNNTGHEETLVFDVSDKSAPMETAAYDVPNFDEGVYVVGDYAYLASGYDGLWIANVGNPDVPRAVSKTDCCPGGGNLAENVWVRDDGNWAWAAEGTVTVYYDTASKTSPSIVATLDHGAWQEGVREKDGYLYVFSHDIPSLPGEAGGVTLVDVSTPSSPVVLDRFDIEDTVTDPADPEGRPKDGYVDDDGHVYVAATSHLWVLRHHLMTDQLSGVADLDVTSIPGHASTELIDLDKRGDYVYASARQAGGGPTTVGVLIFDVSTPSSPQYVTTLATQKGFQGIWIDGDFAYVSTVLSTGDSGVTMLDLTNPTAPAVVDELVMSDTILNTHVSDGRLYGAGFRAGTTIADVDLSPAHVLDEDFSLDLHDWTQVGIGVWAIEDGELSGTDPLGMAPLSVASGTDGATRVAVTARAIGDPGTLGFAAVLFDYQSPSDTKFVVLNASADEWQMGEVVAGVPSVHQVSSDTLSFGVDYDLEVDFTGTTAKLTVGGTPELSHTFTTNGGGGVALGVLSSHCHFDDVEVD